MKVFCRNHGMHATGNVVTLSDVATNTVPTTLTTGYDNNGTGNITVSDTLVGTAYTQFEGINVSASNPGYIKIGDEIISYTGTSGADFTGITRGIEESKDA